MAFQKPKKKGQLSVLSIYRCKIGIWVPVISFQPMFPESIPSPPSPPPAGFPCLFLQMFQPKQFEADLKVISQLISNISLSLRQAKMSPFLEVKCCIYPRKCHPDSKVLFPPQHSLSPLSLPPPTENLEECNRTFSCSQFQTACKETGNNSWETYIFARSERWIVNMG